jgi:CcmD family protein
MPTLLVVLALVLAPPPVVAAQAPEAAYPAAAQPGPVTGDQIDQAAGTPVFGAAAERAAQPRTLRAYWHLFIAFAATWILLFGYALTLGRRFGKLEDEVRRMLEA